MQDGFRYIATSKAGFIQQVAVALIPNGYYHYVACRIPEHKDPLAVDEKLAERYGFAISKWSRSRLPKHVARVQYLRYERFFVLAATEGDHSFFWQEPQREDFRRKALVYDGYAIAAKECNGKTHGTVRMTLTAKGRLRQEVVGFAAASRRVAAERRLLEADLLMYSGVRAQVLQILWTANQALARRGAPAIELGNAFWRRRQVRIFE